MILYHGSNIVFKRPLLGKCSPYKDFGLGFYLSDSFDVARRTALRTVRQRGGEPVVLVFEIDDKEMRKLNYKRFQQPGNRSWAKFVLANRNPEMPVSDHNRDKRYDWVVGPIADDGLAFLFKMFERGYYTLGEVLRRMRFQKKLTTQYSFHTRESLALLKFKEVRNV
jgi:hypothetical protein